MNRADPLRIADYLQHILEAVDNIQDYTADLDLDAFMADRKTRDAVIRNLEVMARRATTLRKTTRPSPLSTRQYLGASPTKCVTHFRTAISR